MTLCIGWTEVQRIGQRGRGIGLQVINPNLFVNLTRSIVGVHERILREIRNVSTQPQRDLLKIAFALYPSRPGCRSVQSRKQQGRQNGDDGNHDQKFDQCERSPSW